MDPIAIVLASLVVATLLISVAIVRRLHRPARPWTEVARARLLLGIPWGSLVVIGVVLGVYLFVQDGITDPGNPVTVPYRAWSYFYPLGMLTASFSHAGPSHLVGNLLGTAIVAPIAEYAWSHYPDERSRGRSGSWWTTPWVRALVIFPGAVVAIGVGTSLFALGPVIGFSGVVFAFAGFALVQYPIVTLIGILGVQGALLTIFRALQNPIHVYVAEASPPGPPAWATIAIQGHALGFMIGIVLGVFLLRRRETGPDPLRLWIGILLFGFTKSLWAIYWFGDGDTFILFQGPGVVVVTALAIIVTLAAAGGASPVRPRWLELADGHHGNGRRSERLERIAALARSSCTRDSTSSYRQSALVAVLVVTAVLAGIAVPLNLLVVDDATVSSDSAVEVESYTVEYAEGVENQLVSPVTVGPFAETVALESSGVIVSSDRHHIWFEAVTSQQLAFTGAETVYVGGPGWREAVRVERAGWNPVGNETVYNVWVAHGDDRALAYESNRSRADVRIDGRTVTVASDSGEFVLEVSANGSGVPATAAIPEERSTSANGLTFEREGKTVYAVSDGTKVVVATEESYD